MIKVATYISEKKEVQINKKMQKIIRKKQSIN